MKKTLFIPIGTFLFFLIILFIYNRYQNKSQIKKISIKNKVYKVEIADNENLRINGLSGRKFLAEDSGMLFIFPSYGIYRFWMKGMNFPLDFVWIKDDTVVDLTQNVSVANDPQKGPFEYYLPSSPVNKVLELSAGEIQKQDIKVGDKIIYN